VDGAGLALICSGITGRTTIRLRAGLAELLAADLGWSGVGSLVRSVLLVLLACSSVLPALG
jgi:hypothetical protein